MDVKGEKGRPSVEGKRKAGQEKKKGLRKSNCRERGNEGGEVERKEFVGGAFLTLMLSYMEKKTQLWRYVEASCACQEALILVNWLQS